MKDMELHPLPGTGAVLKEQIRTVGLALRPLGIGVGLLLVVFGAIPILYHLREPRPTVLLPTDFVAWMSLIGIGLPLFLGRGSVTPFRGGLPWTFPMERARHALIRMAAGWFWLMAAVAVLLIWSVVVPLLTGGAFREPTLYLVAPFNDPRPTDPTSLPTVFWSFPWWIWVVPFLAATAFYLWTSALFLAARRPGRWAAGIILGFFLLVFILDWVNLTWLLGGVEQTLERFLEARYGLMTLMAGGAVPVQGVDMPTGESMPMFVGIPTMGRWLAGSALWIGTGLGLLGLAALRHRDGSGASSGGA